MKIAYCSDTHVDYWNTELNPAHENCKKKFDIYINTTLKPKPADVLIIAGDIGHFNNQNKVFLQMMKDIYSEVIITFGNHDMYLISKSIQAKYKYNSMSRLQEMKEMCSDIGVHVLDGNIIEINGVRFGGTPMWYNLPKQNDIIDWKDLLKDSRLIQNGIVRIYPDYSGYSTRNVVRSTFDTQTYYLNQVANLQRISEQKCDIFVSHVCPVIIPDFIKERNFNTSKYDKFYESNNIELIKRTGAKICIFGHTHIQEEIEVVSIEFVASAIGYGDDESGEIRVLEI